MYICGTPIWQPENSVNIWNFILLLSRQLIVCTEQTVIYVKNTFPNAVTSDVKLNVESSSYMLSAKVDFWRGWNTIF